MKALLRSRTIWLTVVLAGILATTIIAAVLTDKSANVDDLYDWHTHRTLVSREVTSLQDLTDRFLVDQYLYNFLMPPDPHYVLRQPGGMIPILSPESLPASFIDGLTGIYKNGIRTFPIRVYEDRLSVGREIVVENTDGKELARIARAYDYSPDWFAYERHPELDAYDKEQRDFLLAGLDPARIEMRYDLLIGQDDLVKYVWKESITSLSAAEEAEGGGMLLMDWEGGSVTNIQFVEFENVDDAMQVTIAYPDDFTNALDIFTCDGGRGLLDFWWEHAVTTNIDDSTNSITWTDSESTNSYVTTRFYAAADAQVDSDGDGYSDGFEKFVYHTSPTNGNSYPVSVSGSISYTGSLTGPVRMLAVTEEHSWIGCMATMPGLGAYTNSKVANGTSYWFKAYRDCNYNKIREYGEPWGIYSSSSTLVTNDLTGINITLTDDTDEDNDGLPDGWELAYFGSIWTQDGDDDNDGDSLTNAEEYALGTDPANTHNSLLPYATGFESTNSYSIGVLEGQNGWEADAGATVQSGIAHAGEQAVEIEALEATMAKHFVVTNNTVTAEAFVYLGPQFSVPTDLPDTASSLVSFEAGTGIRGFDGNGSGGGSWTNAPGTVDLLNEWVGLKIVQNYSAQTWSLYVNDELKLSGLGFKDDSVTQLEAMHLRSGIGGAVHCDDVAVSGN